MLSLMSGRTIPHQRSPGIPCTFKISHVVSDLSERTSSYACAISGSLRISDGAGILRSSFYYRELREGDSKGEAKWKGSFEEVGMGSQGPDARCTSSS